jgi:hypothetical protein
MRIWSVCESLVSVMYRSSGVLRCLLGSICRGRKKVMLASVDLGCHAGWVRTDLDHLLGWCEQREVSVSWRVLETYLVRRFLKIHVDVTVYVSMLSSTCLTFGCSSVACSVAIVT